MKFKYYGPRYPTDSPDYRIDPIKSENPTFQSDNPTLQIIQQDPYIYQNRLMISEKNLCPTIDWRFRWYDGDEPRWEGYIDDTEVACLHRGTYFLHYKNIDEADAWEDSEYSFFLYTYVRMLEEEIDRIFFDLA